MSEQTPRNLMIPPQGGMLRDLTMRIKLILGLIGDRRVNFFLKLLPIAAALYLVLPFDLAPGLVLPVIGVLDDAAIVWLGSALFLELVPSGIVQEHLKRLTSNAKIVDQSIPPAGDVVDGEVKDVTDKPQDGA